MKHIISALAVTLATALPAASQNVTVGVEGDNTNVSVVVTMPQPVAEDTFTELRLICDVEWWRTSGRRQELQIRYDISYRTGTYREFHNYGSEFEHQWSKSFEMVTGSEIVLQNGSGTSADPYEWIDKSSGRMQYRSGQEVQIGHCREVNLF